MEKNTIGQGESRVLQGSVTSFMQCTKLDGPNVTFEQRCGDSQGMGLIVKEQCPE